MLAASAHKWMLGPLGIGFVHLSPGAMEALNPSAVGWLSVDRPFDFDHEPILAADGRRFESGTENAVGIAGLWAAIDLVLTAGRQAVENRVLDTTAELSALLLDQGWELLRTPDRRHWSGILMATSGSDDETMFERLRAAGVRCSLWGRGIRFSPHCYTSSADLHCVHELVRR